MIIKGITRPDANFINDFGLIDNEYTIRCNLTPEENQCLVDWKEGKCELVIGRAKDEVGEWLVKAAARKAAGMDKD